MTPVVFLSGKELVHLMRGHHVTIRDLSRRLGLPQHRIRFRRTAGFSLTEWQTARDWVQAIHGTDPVADPAAPRHDRFQFLAANSATPVFS